MSGRKGVVGRGVVDPGLFAGIRCSTRYSQGRLDALGIGKGQTMSRRQIWALVASFAFVSLFICIWAYFETHKVRRGNFDRLQLGMTKDQVENLLGGPSNGTIRAPKEATGYHRLYSNRACGIMVYFNPAGEVEDMDFEEYPNRGLLSWLKTLVGL